jgi:glycosyltransferase involved in cell wall biosynthesis
MLLNAVMCVWNEEDIIESTVKHCFAQGCSNVFIVDNASTDRTVEIAINAGAILIDSFESKYFDEDQKIAHLNSVVKKYNEQSNEDYIWWLYIDADEFPNIDCNLSIIDFLKLLNPSIRAVQGYMFNHIPTHPPYHISSYHPIDFQQICSKSDAIKIPLIRYDKDKQHLYSGAGAHTVDTCGEDILVVRNILNIHHFNYREPEYSLFRLKKLLSKNLDGTSRIDHYDNRSKIITGDLYSQSGYHNRYNHAKFVYSENKYKSLISTPVYSYKHITRWYNPLELSILNYSEYETLLCLAIHYFFLENYDLALFKFHDILKITHDKKLQILINIKIAECIYFTDKKEAMSILQTISKYDDVEISNYTNNQLNKMKNGEYQIIHNDDSTILFDVIDYHGEFKSKTFL